MDRDARYLITTADQSTWYKDRPIVFLGPWCRINELDGEPDVLDAEIVNGYGGDERTKSADFAYIKNLYEVLLLEMSEQLNKFHETNHSLRYWRILIGPWLNTFISILFIRWQAIKEVNEGFSITETTLLDFPLLAMIPNSQSDFEVRSLCHKWNHYISGRIISGWTAINCKKISPLISSQMNAINPENSISKISLKQFVRRTAVKGLQKISTLLSTSNDAFLINSYLPLKQDFLLQISLGQLPRLWRAEVEPKIFPDLRCRSKLKLAHHKYEGFENCIRTLIPDQIPVLYLEGYQEINKRASKLPWPTHPKVIFTSNSAHQDELFKIWTATKVEMGIPYVLGQHGGLYGMGRFPTQFEDRELATADRFLTWGWSENNLKQYPCVALKLVGAHKGAWNRSGGLLQVTLLNLRYPRDPWAVAVDEIEYLHEQFRFVACLPHHIGSQLLVRLSAAAISHGYFREGLWRKYCPDVQFDYGGIDIERLIRDNRLFVYTYNSTGYLETMARNIPTIIFWNPMSWEYRSSAKIYFDRLREVGILHDTPESAAKKVASVWDDVESWWDLREVQEAREFFCNRYARISTSAISELKKALTFT